MDKLALHFGAGNIGRGFIAPVLQENNYRVIFVDVDEDLVNKINKEKRGKILKDIKEVINLIKNEINDKEYLMIKGSNSTGLNKISQSLKVGKINAF